MKFVKANIHYQNSSKSVTLNLPEFLFRGHWAVRAFVVVGLLLLVVQFSATFVHDAVLKHVIKSRQYLDRQMVQIEGTLDFRRIFQGRTARAFQVRAYPARCSGP